MTATVHLFCGKPGSGKTTFARRLEQERKAFLLSVDDWMVSLFGERLESEVFDARLGACKDLVYGLTERLTAFGVDVVLDFGFWTREERDAARQRILASGAACELYFFDVADPILKERLAARNANLPPGAYEITESMFDILSQRFEPPTSDEVFVRIEVR